MARPDEIGVETVAAMGPDDLDRLLGEAVLQDAMFGKRPSAGELLAEGREYFTSVLPELRRCLCGNERIAAFFSAEAKDRNTLILAVAEELAGLRWPLVLAARLIYFGYDKLCPRPKA